MRKKLLTGVVVLAVFAFGWLLGSRPEAQGGGKREAVAHMVYFKLKDSSGAAKEKLVAACKKHLTGHPGEVFFAAGTLCEDLKREVNDVDWDVALHMVFKDKAAHDQYQVSLRHEDFIKENRDNWSKVRVFDSYVSK